MPTISSPVPAKIAHDALNSALSPNDPNVDQVQLKKSVTAWLSKAEEEIEWAIDNGLNKAKFEICYGYEGVDPYTAGAGLGEVANQLRALGYQVTVYPHGGSSRAFYVSF